ncbi:MAG TPA: O-antigen ligase family protein [Planctomycetota bacterium]|jgi:hypothetical protein|nr:O-antigen ligase family protein [Planctomycetota bacterium]
MTLGRASSLAVVGFCGLAAALVCAAATASLTALPDFRYAGALLLGVLALAFGAFGMLRPREALLVFLGFAPVLNAYMFFTGHLPDPRGGALKHVLWAGIVGGWFLRGIVTRRFLSGEGTRRRAPDTVFLLYALYAVAQGTRQLPIVSVGGLVLVLQGIRQELEFLLAFFVARDVLEEPRDLRRLAVALALATAGTAAVGGMQALHLLPAPFGPSVISGVERVDSVVMEANNFAWTLGLGVPVFLARATRPGFDAPRLLAGGVVLLFAGLVAASGSRTGFAVLACASIGIVVGRRRPAYLLALLPCVAAGVLAFPLLSDRFREVTEVGTVAEARLRMWRRLSQLAEENPLFGGGYGWVGGAVSGVTEEQTQWADSTPVHVGVQFGAVGLLLFVGGLLAALLAGGGGVRRAGDPETRALGSAFLGALVGCVAISPVHIPWIPFPTSLYAWTLLGVLVGFERFDAGAPRMDGVSRAG